MKTALITGASRGLGQALAIFFEANKYNLILQARESKIDAMTGIDVVKGDLRSEDTLAALTRLAEDRDVDILINNAGIYANKSFAATSKDDFREMIGVNLLAPILLTKAVWPIFQQKQSGLVININSIAGKVGSNGETAYCASKHGLRGFSNALQFDATKDGIRVINVNLGGMNTDMTKHRADAEKLISVSEVAHLIFNLCKDYESLRITETDINRRIY